MYILFSTILAVISAANAAIYFGNIDSKDMNFINRKHAKDMLPTYGALTAEQVYGTPDLETGERVSNWDPKTSKVNPEELGSYAEGDILIPYNARTLEARNGYLTTSRWTGGIVPYEMAGTYTADELAIINAAFASYHDLTCIKFVVRTTEADYVRIESNPTGCFSNVGRSGGMQILNLQGNVGGSSCLFYVGTTIHEFMHALGFLHEQSRYERDTYVTIDTTNIQAGKENNFEKTARNVANTEMTYDFGSVMHYTAFAFAIDTSKQTITAKRALPTGATMGQRTGFSRRDVEKIRIMYKCEGKVSHV